MKEKAQKFMKKGKEIVEMNEKAIDAGATAYVKIDVPADWADAVDAPKAVSENGPEKLVKMVDSIMRPVGLMNGDSLRFPSLLITQTAHSSRAHPPMRSAASRSWFPSGTQRPAHSATSAPSSARTQLSARTF